MPRADIQELFRAGVHFGHKTRRWHPSMAPYIYGERHNIHIIDLDQTAAAFDQARHVITSIVQDGGRVLFVGTKRQASDVVAHHAKRCGQPYINHRWLGGTLTNWPTISNSIRKLRETEKQIESPSFKQLTKKERLLVERRLDKLNRAFGGIKDMGGLPDLIFIIDAVKEHIAIEEANSLKIPVVAIVDTNVDPHAIDYPIPGNDDSVKAIELYCQLISGAVLEGIKTEMARGKPSRPADAKSASTTAESDRDHDTDLSEYPTDEDDPSKDATVKSAAPKKSAPAQQSSGKSGKPANTDRKPAAKTAKPVTTGKNSAPKPTSSARHQASSTSAAANQSSDAAPTAGTTAGDEAAAPADDSSL